MAYILHFFVTAQHEALYIQKASVTREKHIILFICYIVYVMFAHKGVYNSVAWEVAVRVISLLIIFPSKQEKYQFIEVQYAPIIHMLIQ